MVRYRITHKTEGLFGCEFEDIKILEAEDDISKKEIARRLNIDSNSIIEIDVL
jgi:hypothetical protein